LGKGWIKLFRQITDSWLWNSDEPFDRRSAWIDLLLLANHEEHKAVYKGEVITLKKGDVNRSLKWLGRRWHRSRWWVSSTLKLFQSDGMITINSTTHQTTVTIVKYGLFQDSPTTNQTANRTTDQTTNQTTSRQHTRMLKNVEECKEVCVEQTHTAPTIEDVLQAAPEMTQEEARRFIDYNSASGWRLEWRYALGRWLERSAAEEKEQKGQKRSNNRFDNFPERDYSSGDLEELERILNAKPI